MSSTKKAIPFEIFELDTEGYHLKIKALINHREVDLIIDTGASKTTFDLQFIKTCFPEEDISLADQLSTGLGTSTMECFEINLAHFAIGGLELSDYHVAVVDLSHVNHAYTKLELPEIQGILGNDILVRYQALIDYQHKQLWLN